jgi:hypothetical protein
MYIEPMICTETVEITTIGTMEVMLKVLREETAVITHVPITTIIIVIIIIATVGTIVRDKIRLNTTIDMVKTKIAAMVVLTMILIMEDVVNNRTEPILSPTDKRTDPIKHRREPILNLTDRKTDLIRHRKEEMPNARGEIRNRRAIGNNPHNARLKAENLPQDALGLTMEIPINRKEKIPNLALLTTEINSHAPIGIILSNALRNNHNGIQSAPTKVKTDPSDAAEINRTRT